MPAFDDDHEFDDLDADVFDVEAFGEEDAPGAGPAMPMASAVSAHLLVEGRTGVSYDALVLFAEPLFEQYGLDLADAFALKADPRAADPEVLAVLEAARVLWAFFSLPLAERARRRNALAAQLVGPAPSEDDWLDIEALLDAMSPYWKAMLPEEIARAEATGHPTLDFDALLAHPAFHLDGDHGPRAYGPDALSEIEARALFAQPLLDDPSTLTDPEAFEDAMERINAYWALAQIPAADRESALRDASGALAGHGGDLGDVEREARRMVERFHVLFPEHARAA
ncbi:MAG: hypothetical protein R3181_01420 [Rubricoccaceae bacterium]|nr:hypothetical protein [Rubricoccaceae bacterium]